MSNLKFAIGAGIVAIVSVLVILVAPIFLAGYEKADVPPAPQEPTGPIPEVTPPISAAKPAYEITHTQGNVNEGRGPVDLLAMTPCSPQDAADDECPDSRWNMAYTPVEAFSPKIGKINSLEYQLHYLINNYRAENGLSESEMALDMFEGWRTSPGHNENMLGEFWVNAGIGIAINEHAEIVATQNFC